MQRSLNWIISEFTFEVKTEVGKYRNSSSTTRFQTSEKESFDVYRDNKSAKKNVNM